jgi:hypothetical protein
MRKMKLRKLTPHDVRVLRVLNDKGPQWNGSLGLASGLSHKSRVFTRLEREALIIGGNPMQITEAGRRALSQVQ